jgi:hypothetical protein
MASVKKRREARKPAVKKKAAGKKSLAAKPKRRAPPVPISDFEAELAQILETDTRTLARPAPIDDGKTLTSQAADELVGGKWFAGYTNAVRHFDEQVVLATFDQSSRGGDAEYLLFRDGLTIDGTLDLSRIHRSIIAVLGTLKARRIILGDAVVVVGTRVEASELVFSPRTEGLFSIAGRQLERDAERFAALFTAPTIALYDRHRRLPLELSAQGA